jgi:protein SCO1/2
VPNQAFVDQDGRTRDFDTIRGDRAIAVTFIYTKCPIPTFCPAMDRQFAEAQALMKDRRLEGKAGLLSVSFDPKNDTPPVLTRHARKLGADPKVWTFVTGDREAIDRFASSLLLTLVRPSTSSRPPEFIEGRGAGAANPDEIGHTLRTTIVDRRGKIAKSYSGADWTPAELVAELERLL